MNDVLISIACHFFERLLKLVREDIGVDVLPLLVDDPGDAELDIGNVVPTSLDEDGYDVLRHLALVHERHHSSQRVEANHAVVVSLLIGGELGNDIRQVVVDDPVVLESLG